MQSPLNILWPKWWWEEGEGEGAASWAIRGWVLFRAVRLDVSRKCITGPLPTPSDDIPSTSLPSWHSADNDTCPLPIPQPWISKRKQGGDPKWGRANEWAWALIAEWEGKTLSLEAMAEGTQEELVRGSVEGRQSIVCVREKANSKEGEGAGAGEDWAMSRVELIQRSGPRLGSDRGQEPKDNYVWAATN